MAIETERKSSVSIFCIRYNQIIELLFMNVL